MDRFDVNYVSSHDGWCAINPASGECWAFGEDKEAAQLCCDKRNQEQSESNPALYILLTRVGA